MYYKTFDELNMNQKKDILLELNLMYDLTTEKGINSLKKEFKYIEHGIKQIMTEKEL